MEQIRQSPFRWPHREGTPWMGNRKEDYPWERTVARTWHWYRWTGIRTDKGKRRGTNRSCYDWTGKKNIPFYVFFRRVWDEQTQRPINGIDTAQQVTEGDSSTHVRTPTTRVQRDGSRGDLKGDWKWLREGKDGCSLSCWCYLATLRWNHRIRSHRSPQVVCRRPPTVPQSCSI